MSKSNPQAKRRRKTRRTRINEQLMMNKYNDIYKLIFKHYLSLSIYTILSIISNNSIKSLIVK